MLRKIAFLTLENTDGYFIYDELVKEPLAQLGWTLESLPWTAKGIDWDCYQGVVIRSTWDYQLRFNEFKEVLEEISRSRALLANSLRLVSWNLHKSYLDELARRDIPTIPTLWRRSLQCSDIEFAFSELKAEEIVVKPCIGANADGAFRLKPSDDRSLWQQASEAHIDRDCMLQPFVDSIVRTGEVSLVFFIGKWSHAVLKKPASKDFRVQEEHGGIITALRPAADELKVAELVMKALPEVPLYGRVDLVRLEDGRPAVIEVELCEPSLYLAHCEGAAARFARAIVDFFA